MEHAKCGHSEATCHGDICLKGAPRPGPVPEIKIEQDRDNRIEHARAVYHMAVQRAEAELDGAIARANEIWAAELCALRHTAHTTERTAA